MTAEQEQAEVDDARRALAAQLRRGMHLVVGRELATAQITSLTASLKTQFDALESVEQRNRSTKPWEGPEQRTPPEDGEAFVDSLDRPISGSGNPFSVPMTMYRDGDAVVSTVTLESGFEGAPGRSHGGIVSAIFDDLFGSLPMLKNKIAFTGSLTVNYLAPSPVHEPVTYRGWVNRVEGKKIFIEGTAHHDGTLVTTSNALFIDATELMAKLYSA